MHATDTMPAWKIALLVALAPLCGALGGELWNQFLGPWGL